MTIAIKVPGMGWSLRFAQCFEGWKSWFGPGAQHCCGGLLGLEWVRELGSSFTRLPVIIA